MKECVFAGTFDPITYGHMDIIQRASNLFDVVHVAMLNNDSKTPMFSVEQRMKFLQESTCKITNVKTHYSDGLLVEFMKKIGVNVIVKGLRTSTDFDYERTQENINKTLNPSAEVIYLGSSFSATNINSSTVRELIRHRADISKYIPFVFNYKNK